MSKVLEHPLTLIASAVLFVVFSISLRQTAHKSGQSQAEIATLEETAYLLSEEVQQLQDNLEYAKSQDHKESIIRNQLLLQKNGEYTLYIPAPETTEYDTDITYTQPPSNQEKWLELVF